MHWKFREIYADEVESEITQRDQFSNDDLGLVDALGREVTQNTQDAIDGKGGSKASRLVFTFTDDLDQEFFKSLFDGVEDHLKNSGIDPDSVNWESPRALIIEDFGTTGLTGSYQVKDGGNFSDFWRRHGRSHKGGQNLGRWGLGKLVFSNSSLLRIFFGLTIRSDDEAELFMGQAVLSNHSVEKKEYAPHGFFAEQPAEIQLPLTNTDFISRFKKELGLKREKESGLSLIIPFPAPVITQNKLLEVLILNYFFPILSGQLVIDVNGEVVDQENLHEMTAKHAESKISDAEVLFKFIEGIHDYDPDDLIKAKQSWHDSGKMSEKSFIPDDLEKLRNQFSSGCLIGVRLPIKITKNGKEEGVNFNVFLQKPESLKAGADIYVRGSLMIPGEAKFGYRKALGALMATDKPLTSFLGDAENPAHTRWNGSADKLKKYSKAPETLKAIRNSVVQLHDLLAQAVETESDDPLRSFFSLPGAGNPKNSRRKRKKIDPPPPPPPIPKPIRIESIDSGFRMIPNDLIEPDDFPLSAKITVAYNRPDGGAFRRYSRLDFDLGSAPITVDSTNITVVDIKDNILNVQIDTQDFELNVTGFDNKREPIVKVNT